MESIENTENDLPPAGWEDGNTSDHGGNSLYCPEGLGRGQLREYLIRLQADALEPGDEKISEHVGYCQACSEIIEDLYASGEVPQSRVDFKTLVPLLQVEAVGASRTEDATVERLAEKFAGRIIAVHNPNVGILEKIVELDRDYEARTIMNQQAKREKIDQLPRARKEALQEQIIALVGSAVGSNPPEKPRLKVVDEEGYELLEGLTALPTGNYRAWRLDPDSLVPVNAIVDLPLDTHQNKSA